jgi:hypothetical protein
VASVVLLARTLTFGGLAVVAVSPIKVALAWPAVGEAEEAVAAGVAVRCRIFWSALALSGRVEAVPGRI